MEFTRLADVEVVETATDVDKVLIEQNGEIKRVPKTEVGGSGGGMLIAELTIDTNTGAVTGSTNMTLAETITAINNHELTGAIAYMDVQGMAYMMPMSLVDGTLQMGAPCIIVMISIEGDTQVMMWNADGFTLNM